MKKFVLNIVLYRLSTYFLTSPRTNNHYVDIVDKQYISRGWMWIKIAAILEKYDSNSEVYFQHKQCRRYLRSRRQYVPGLFTLQCYTSIYCFWWIKTFLLSSFESEPSTPRNKTAMFIWSRRRCLCSLYARRFLSQNYEPLNNRWPTVNMNCCVQCKFVVKTQYTVLADKYFYILWVIALKITKAYTTVLSLINW